MVNKHQQTVSHPSPFSQTHLDVGSIDSTLSLNGSSSGYESRDDGSDTHDSSSGDVLIVVFYKGVFGFAKKKADREAKEVCVCTGGSLV
jgi:hypothetical protein